jgi:hypothetical protein
LAAFFAAAFFAAPFFGSGFLRRGLLGDRRLVGDVGFCCGFLRGFRRLFLCGLAVALGGLLGLGALLGGAFLRAPALLCGQRELEDFRG